MSTTVHTPTRLEQRGAVDAYGRWRLTRLLGQGALTRVFQASPAERSDAWPADYVLKTSMNGPADPLALDLLRREAEACRKVTSPHLPSLLEADLNEQQPFLIFPYLAGGSIDQRLARFGVAPPAMTFWILRQTLAALRELHASGWAHGDVKPANILVGRDGHTTLIDLGFAQRLHDPPTKKRLLMATPAYAAPEVHLGGPATAASDLYSLGSTAFELLTGKPPFQAATPDELAKAHRLLPAPDLRAQHARLPFEAARLVRRLLAKDPAERPTLCEAEAAVLRLEIECFDQHAG